jgi:hypothetical protein
MKMYDVTLRCGVKALSDLLSAVDGAADLVSVKESLEQAPPAPKPEPLTWRNNDGGMAPNPDGRGKLTRRSRKDGVSGWQLLLDTVSNPNRTYTMTEIKREFKAMGFAENSPHSLIYRAIKEGKIRNCGGSIYQRVAEPPKANGAA